MPPPQQGNGFAIAGIILAILVWPLGLIFSIIGLAKSKARAGAGKTLSIIALILSVVVGAATIGLVAVVANSPAADPGCLTAESSARSMLGKFNSDTAAMNADQSNSTAERADINKFLTDARTLQSQLASAQAEAVHQSVKNKIGAMATDLGTMTTGLQAAENGDSSQLNSSEAASNRLGTDGDAIDSICSTF